MKTTVRYILAFLLTLVLMTLTLVWVAEIPREEIQEKSEESAEYLMRRDVPYYNIVGGASGRTVLRPGDYSKADQTADAYLLSIAYYLEPEHPLESVLWARYYEGREDPLAPLKNMNESYLRSVREQTPTNKQYLRYWHGSLLFVRPMLRFWNIRQMTVFHAAEMGGLLCCLIWLLLKNGLKAEAVCILISMTAVSVWFVPISLEYTWMFLLMLIAAILAVKLALGEKLQGLCMLFFLTGMWAAYLDFFTTETITVLIPMLLALRILHRKNGLAGDRKPQWKLAGTGILLWGTGYVLTWVSKWGLAALVFKVNTIPYVRGRLLLHLGKDSMPAGQEMLGAVIRNLYPMFPFGYGLAGGVLYFFLVLLFILIPVYRNKVVLRKERNRGRILLYVLLGMVVYLRYLVLNQHSYKHYFFTYRAQAASVLALCFIILELVEILPGKTVTHE